jgi:hypothetical protein
MAKLPIVGTSAASYLHLATFYLVSLVVIGRSLYVDVAGISAHTGPNLAWPADRLSQHDADRHKGTLLCNWLVVKDSWAARHVMWPRHCPVILAYTQGIGA